MSLTHWQIYRQRNRHRPLKQVLHLVGFVLLLFLYSITFFQYQPDRSHETIVALNASLKENRAKEVEAKRLRLEHTKMALPYNQDGDPVSELEDIPNKPSHRIINILFLFYAMGLITRIYILARVPRRETRRQQRLLQEERQERFRAWTQRLNFQRQASGQQPISLDSLQLVMREREMTGEDYDNLLQFDEEAGPAMESMLNSIGATQDEISRCPLRTLTSDDELLTRTTDGMPQQCPICLENYQPGQQVRTIPCFHSFHKDCIDPWLLQRAVCPVCKHSATG
jgi:hypothetical protein